MPKDNRKKKRAYKVAMLLKYWKVNKEPLMDLCMIIAMYAQDIEAGLLYAVGFMEGFATRHGSFKSINTLSRITLKNKDEKEALVKSVMNGGWIFHAFLCENGTIRVVNKSGPTFDIVLESDIIAMNSGNYSTSLFAIDTKMCTYEIKDNTPVRLDGIKIKDISCSALFTVFLSECGRVFGIGSNRYSRLGLPRRIERTEISTEIPFPNQSDSDKNEIIITMTHASRFGWVAVDSKQRAWIIGDYLMESVRSDYKSVDPCIGIVEVWHSNGIQITQIKCGCNHVIALDAKGRVYWFGRFDNDMPLSRVSSGPIPFSHQIISIRSGVDSVACKDATNEWYVWGWNTFNHITGLCGCETVCKETKDGATISNPMRCEWQELFDSSRVINLQLGRYKAHVIVDSF